MSFICGFPLGDEQNQATSREMLSKAMASRLEAIATIWAS